ncbi:MAG: family 20 glycosylhydrolase [Opitutales bacterium]|nr:family 20 glycosylhydrolase [Opitutales bacterium]
MSATSSEGLADLGLFPPPTAVRAGAVLERPGVVSVSVSTEAERALVGTVLRRRGVPFEIVTRGGFLQVGLEAVPDDAEGMARHSQAQAYQLFSSGDGWRLRAGGRAGLRYGLDTFAQIWRKSEGGRMPGGEVVDEPSVAVRGWMLDVSRCRVPTMRTLRELVGVLERWRINQLQLYTEHTFAYPGHEGVWGDASPLSAEDYRALDGYCKEMGIELVPNQNSFGHFERWLKHPEYKHLAESPDGFHHFSGRRWRHGTTLFPGKESRAFVRSLYAALLPQFSSPLFNIGGDEPWELGLGRSAERCRVEGKLAVYLSFLRDLMADARAHGRTPQFWADVLLEEGGQGADVPAEAIPLIWGYEADHPFAEEAARIAGTGRRFYICPGTSCWNSLGGRLHTARKNLQRAAEAAVAYRAEGLLITSWGDGGHHQPYAVSLAALALGAARGWAAAADPARGLIPALADAFSAQPSFVEALLKLGDLSGRVGPGRFNRSALSDLLHAEDMALPAVTKDLPLDDLEAAAATLKAVNGDLIETSANDLCAGVDVAAGLLSLAVDRGRYFLRRELTPHAPKMRIRLNDLLGRYEAAWLANSRPGGLHESSGHLRKLADHL